MYELSLRGVVAESRYDQLLNILAGITGMPPKRATEQHMIYRPNRTFIRRDALLNGAQDVQKAAKKVTQESSGDLYYLQLVCRIDCQSNRQEQIEQRHDGGDAMDIDGQQDVSTEGRHWELRFYDNPETGNIPVTSRMAGFIALAEEDPVEMMDGLDYIFCRHYTLECHQFAHNHVLISMHRMFRSMSQTTPDPASFQADTSGLHLYDTSGTYMLEASIRLEDNTNSKLMQSATAELQRLRETLKGVVDLKKIDRMALMTRVAATGPST